MLSVCLSVESVYLRTLGDIELKFIPYIHIYGSMISWKKNSIFISQKTRISTLSRESKIIRYFNIIFYFLEWRSNSQAVVLTVTHLCPCALVALLFTMHDSRKFFSVAKLNAVLCLTENKLIHFPVDEWNPQPFTLTLFTEKYIPKYFYAKSVNLI